ncbi:cbb3-type cytochrome c oxidase N-terminal domain-containing protein [Edaphocola aurantiacus]|uniref:cbb3-type cytochrome c oxidase N-terminal domain-containing protein n=1 Tax=Edaphocola aurantiacus TaxID=2601682 RepID=UPI001C97D576|nr:cbb3-type cytochrome c oxidase N-terminal domain-containing protein [Edaphocola aurantiacus]
MRKILSLIALTAPNILWAADPTPATASAGPESPWAALANPVAIIMVTILIVLLFVIIFLSRIVLNSLEFYKAKRQAEKRKSNSSTLTAILIPLLLFSGLNAFAQTADEAAEAAPKAVELIGGMNPTLFYTLFGVFILEVVVIVVLLSVTRFLVGLERKKEYKKEKGISWWEKMNATKSLDAASEAEANWGHSYDGIEELDNPTPPWWVAGFALSVIVGVIYFYRYDIAKTAPNQLEEYAIEVQKGEAAKLAYLASAANNVDENTVTVLTEATDIEAGKAVFVQVCAACHGADGGGSVGPNLTDDYWLHGGGIKDIFRTITVGVQDKGMKSWKDDYSPRQIQQIASYIKTLHGTKPATPKASQGELYIEESKENSTQATAAHGTATAADSTSVQ